MMKTNRYLAISLIVLALMTAGMQAASGQGHTAIQKRIHISRGKTKTVSGKTDSSTSYIYSMRAQKDQQIEARLTSEGGAMTFSIVPPAGQGLGNAAGVTEWSGTIPETGEYLIIVATNSTSANKIPYTLSVTAR